MIPEINHLITKSWKSFFRHILKTTIKQEYEICTFLLYIIIEDEKCENEQSWEVIFLLLFFAQNILVVNLFLLYPLMT